MSSSCRHHCSTKFLLGGSLAFYFCSKNSQCLINQISKNDELFRAAKKQEPKLAANLIYFFKIWYYIANQLDARAGHT